MRTAEPTNSPLVVLWTEDDENDRLMITVAIERAGRELKIMFVEDGEEAWQYIDGTGKFCDRTEFPPPAVVITDLKMPRCDGFELVEKIRADRRYKKLPVYVFSASDLAVDRTAAQRLGVDGYITKPMGFGLWSATVVSVVDQAAAHLRAA